MGSLKLGEMSYGFCPGANEPFDLLSLSVVPDPIVVATGEDISLQIQLQLNQPVPEGATVSLKMKKKGIIDLPFPALKLTAPTLDPATTPVMNSWSSLLMVCALTTFPKGSRALPLNPGLYGST